MTKYLVSCDKEVYDSIEELKGRYKGIGIRGRIIIKELDEFQYLNDETIKNRILDGWSSGNYKFEPESNTGEIFTYYGKVKFDSRGEQKEIQISLQH